MNFLYLLFAKYNKKQEFIENILILYEYYKIENFCEDNSLYFELCVVDLIQNKINKAEDAKFNPYVSDFLSSLEGLLI